MADKDTVHNLLGVRIRRGVPEDAAALAEFGRRLFVENFADRNDPQDLADYVRKNYNTARQTAELCSEDEITLLAELDDSLIGYAQVRKNPPPTDIRLKDPLELHRYLHRQPLPRQRSGTAIDGRSARIRRRAGRAHDLAERVGAKPARDPLLR